MNEYVFYTTEGVTLPPKEDKVVDNCQILGFVKAKNISEAKDLLRKIIHGLLKLVFPLARFW